MAAQQRLHHDRTIDWTELAHCSWQLGMPATRQPLVQGADEGVISVSVGSRIAEVEEKLILATLRQCDTKEKAAQLLGISSNDLWNLPARFIWRRTRAGYS